MKITFIGKRKTQVDAEAGSRLFDVMKSAGEGGDFVCGGRGICGKCKVRIREQGEEEREVLACKYTVECDLEVYSEEKDWSVISEFRGAKYGNRGAENLEYENFGNGEDRGSGTCVAVDIGTTTMVCSLLVVGKSVGAVVRINPQRALGADVISRIDGAAEHGEELTKTVREALGNMIEELKADAKVARIERAFVTGNTAMLQLFLGKDVSGMGEYPYKVEGLESVSVRGSDVGIDVEEVTTAPCVSAFVGGDVVCGALAVGLGEGDLLVDIGTNGEIMTMNGGRIFCTSVAAGPAFEGGNISRGCGAVEGAICGFYLENGVIVAKTIGKGDPASRPLKDFDPNAVGICGSGLLDAVALMRELDILEESGAFCQEEREDGTPLRGLVSASSTHTSKSSTEEGVLLKGIVSARDVRAFQLAKGAIATGIEELAKAAGLSMNEIKNVYIAGGMGLGMNVESAVRLGLLPSALKGRTKAVGNGALAGAEMCATCTHYLEKCKAIAGNAVSLDLSAEASFAEEFIKHLSLVGN